jgi:hypothetical protein
VKQRVIIANSSGFWGDDPAARDSGRRRPHRLPRHGLLAEAMAILQKQRARRPDTGFAADFVAAARIFPPVSIEASRSSPMPA